jgi:putative inorganic carbon (HCO3(-)) transporter
MWVALLIPALWIFNLATIRRVFAPTPLNILLLSLLIMVGVSLWATFDIPFSLGKVAGTLLGFFLFLGLVQFADSESRLWLTVVGFLLGGLALGAVALVGTGWWDKFPVIGKLVRYFPVRLRGIPGAEEGFNPNAVGGSITLFLPLIPALLWPGVHLESVGKNLRRMIRIGLWILLVPLSGVLLLSQSRGAWLAISAAVVLVASVRFRWVRWTVMAAILIALILGLVYQPWNHLMAEQQSITSGAEISLAARLEIWSRAIYGIQDFPFTGMGMNTFRKVVHVLYPLFTISPDVDIASAHNNILQTALDLGIPGMIAYVGVWSAAAWMLAWVFRHSGNQLHRRIAIGLGAGLFAQFVYGINDAIPLGAKVGIFWWVALAITAALFRLETADKSMRPRAPAWEILLMWILLSLVAISFVGNHPYAALAIGVLGGVYLGYLSVPSLGEPLDHKET